MSATFVLPMVGADPAHVVGVANALAAELALRGYSVAVVGTGEAEADIVLAVGLADVTGRRIEVHSSQQGPNLLSAYRDLHCVITDLHLKTNVPQYGEDELDEVADLVENIVGQKEYL